MLPIRFAATAAMLLTHAFALHCLAIPTQVVYVDTPDCDPLAVPTNVHELGTQPTFAPFPTEFIAAAAIVTDRSACPATDDPLIPNYIIILTNLTTVAWENVWYVADPPAAGVGTSISNFDGYVDAAPSLANPGRAFKIDAVGVNRPLIDEQLIPNGRFDAGEPWVFILQDYTNGSGLNPALYNSIGVGGASAGGPLSSGSIIAVAVPEPTTAVSLLANVLIALRVRRSRTD